MTAIGFGEWKAMWDKSGPWPVITHADAHLLLGEIARLESELDAIHLATSRETTTPATCPPCRIMHCGGENDPHPACPAFNHRATSTETTT